MKRFEDTEKVYPDLWSEVGQSHRSHPNEIEEDLLVLFHSFVLQLHVPLGKKGYREWFEDENNKYFAYLYHRLFFQMLNAAWKPESHWVLKAPVHSMYVSKLQEQYPDARFIFTHRDPLAVVPSWARLLESYLNWSYLPNTGDKFDFGKYIAESLILCAERVMEWQESASKECYFDVVYSKMMEDPIQMVKNIYAHFNIEFSDEFEQNMVTWMKENRQGKYGRRKYSLEEYGLSKDGINKMFSEYNKKYF